MNHSAPDYQTVDSRDSLRRLVDAARAAARIALDSEADSLHSYFEKVCLLQLSIDGECYIVDPLAGLDLAALLDVLAEKPLVLHGGDYDLRMLRASFGFRPRSAIFDTMLVAQLLGYQQFGLGTLVKRFFGVDLPKAGQKADWSRRPLPPHLLQYASDDTRYLLRLADLMMAELRRLGREEWARETCASMVASTATDREVVPDRQWRVKGSHNVKGLGLALLKEIWTWRESEAQRVDLPPFRVMPNSMILDLAHWAQSNPAPHAVQQLGTSPPAGPKLPRNCVGRRLTCLREAVDRALRMRKSDWPPPWAPRRPARGPVIDQDLVEALRRERDRVAGELQIDPAIVANRAALEAIARQRPRTADELRSAGSLMQWQTQLLTPGLLRAMRL